MNVFATSPAHAPAREARAQIDLIATSLKDSSSRLLDRRGVGDRLARAIRSLYAVLDTTPEAPAHHDGLDECARVLTEARALLAAAVADHVVAAALARLEVTLASITKARETIVDTMITSHRDPRSSRRAGAGPAITRPFQASVSLPQLHALARAPLAPAFDLEASEPFSVVVPRKPPPPKPQTLDELRAAAAAPPSPPEAEEPPVPAEPAPRPPPMDDGEIVRRVARECLEDIAGLRVLRKPIATETWLDQIPFEQRLLDNIDAFVSLGARALPSVTLFHAEAPAPDPSRAFAVALTLGSIEGTDTVDIAIATLKQSAPPELPAFAEGFILAPSLAIDTELPALLDAPNPALVSVALETLGARGTLPLEAVELVLPRKDPLLTKKLAFALGRSYPKTRAIGTLNDLIDGGADDDLFFIAIASLLRRGESSARQRIREAMRVPTQVARALPLLALAGRGEDAPMLIEALTLSPTAEAIRGLARFGSTDAIPALIALLDHEELAPIAAESLDFMTNAGLVETTEVPWSDTPPEDGSPVPMRKVVVPIADRLAWENWFVRARPQLDPRVKLRHGRPFVPSMLADELSKVGPAAPREDAALELVVATGLGMRFATSDWVKKQQRQLGEVREVMPSLGSAAGAWWFAGTPINSR